MKQFIANYLLYIYLNYIKEDYSTIRNKAIPFIKTLAFIHGIYIWIASIIFFYIFIIGMIFEKNKKELEKIINIYLTNNKI
jgi:hypothetical protein